LFDALASALDALSVAGADQAVSAGIGGAWTIVAELGFAPSLDSCASCGTPLAPDVPVRFAHRAGGALCAKCAASAPGARELPPDARALIRTWIDRGTGLVRDEPSARAHLRLLREFLQEHLGDERPLRAFAVWERGVWLAR